MHNKTLASKVGHHTLNLLLKAFLIFWAIAVIYPLVWMIISSFKDTNGIYLSTWSLPDTFHIENYKMAGVDYNIGRAFLNTLLVAVLATVMNLIMAIPTAYVIERITFRYNSALMNFYLMAMMIPACMGWIPLYFLLYQLKLLDNLVVLALIYAVGKLPFSIYILTSFISAVPAALEEAATLDGMSRYGVLFRLLPQLIRSGIITVVVMNVIQFWSEYFMALIFIQNSEKKTLGVMMNVLSSNAQHQNAWGALFAGLVISTLPVIIIYATLNKHVVKGMMEGALKG